MPGLAASDSESNPQLELRTPANTSSPSHGYGGGDGGGASSSPFTSPLFTPSTYTATDGSGGGGGAAGSYGTARSGPRSPQPQTSSAYAFPWSPTESAAATATNACAASLLQATTATVDVHTDKDNALDAVTIDGANLQHCSADLQDDDEVVRAAVMASGFALEFASTRLRSNVDIALLAVTCPASNNKDRYSVCERRTRAYGPFTKVVPPDLQKNKVILCNTLLLGGIALDSDLIPFKFRADADVVSAAVAYDAGQLAHADVTLRSDPAICAAAIKKNGASMQFVSLALREQDGFLESLRGGPNDDGNGYIWAELTDRKAQDQLQKDLNILNSRHDYFAAARFKVVYQSMQHSTVTVEMEGPLRSPYYTGRFQIDCLVPEDYPYSAPVYRFLTPVFHPAVGAIDGIVDMQYLRKHNGNKWDPSDAFWGSAIEDDLKLIEKALKGKVMLNDSCVANVHSLKIWRADINRAWFCREARYRSIDFAGASASLKQEDETFDVQLLRSFDFIEATKQKQWVADRYLRATRFNLDGAITLFEQSSSGAVDDNGLQMLDIYVQGQRAKERKKEQQRRHNMCSGGGSDSETDDPVGSGSGFIGDSMVTSGSRYPCSRMLVSSNGDEDGYIADTDRREEQLQLTHSFGPPDRSPQRNDSSQGQGWYRGGFISATATRRGVGSFARQNNNRGINRSSSYDHQQSGYSTMNTGAPQYSQTTPPMSPASSENSVGLHPHYINYQSPIYPEGGTIANDAAEPTIEEPN